MIILKAIQRLCIKFSTLSHESDDFVKTYVFLSTIFQLLGRNPNTLRPNLKSLLTVKLDHSNVCPEVWGAESYRLYLPIWKKMLSSLFGEKKNMLSCPSPQCTCMHFMAKFHVRHSERHSSNHNDTVENAVEGGQNWGFRKKKAKKRMRCVKWFCEDHFRFCGLALWIFFRRALLAA